MSPLMNEPKSKGGFNLGDYVEVKDRIHMFYAAFPEGRLVTDRAELWMELEPPRVVVKALAYRTPDDPQPGVGWSWMVLPGTTSYTKGSELENTETSAWGRAIGSLGIGIDKSIASANEVKGHSGDSTPDKPPSVEETEGGLIGVASLGKAAPVDGELRETPTGYAIGFVIGEGRDKVQVVATDELAGVLAAVVGEFIGQRVQVYGTVSIESMRVGNYDRKFPRLALERIVTPDWTLPARVEAVPEPMFPDDAELEAIAAAELAEANA